MGEYWRGERSLRSVRVLLAGLPPDNAIAREHYGHAWTTDPVWLLADAVDAMNIQAALTYNANQPRSKQVKAPEKVPRPEMPDDLGDTGGVEAGERDDAELEGIRSEMDEMRARIFTQA